MKGLLVVVGLSAGVVYAQRGGADWMVAGGDAQRTSWVKTDAKISVASMQKGGLDLLWKVDVGGSAAPVLLDRYIGYRGFRSLAFIGGAGGKVTGIDDDLGRVEWSVNLPTGAAPCKADTLVTRPTTSAIGGAANAFGGGGRRGGAAKSGVGEPLQGAVTIQQVAATPGGGGRGGRGPDGAANVPRPRRMPALLHALTPDGMLHSLYVSNGEPSGPATRLVPSGSVARDVITVDDVVYATIASSCDGAPSAIVALNPETKATATYKVASGSLTAPAFSAESVYTTTSAGELVGLEPKTLRVKTTYKAGAEFTSGPVVFEHKEKTVVAAAAKDGRVHVVDGATAVAKSDQAASPVAALATWQDASGMRWLVGASKSGLSAWKFGEALQSAWSRELTAPVEPIVVNGVILTASPAVRAIDAATGKDLWNSGSKLPGSAHVAGVSFGNTELFAGTNDGHVYSIGFPIEH